MSSVQPPGRFVCLGVDPWRKKPPGGGHVCALAGMSASMENGAFVKALLSAVFAGVPVVSVQVVARGVGEVRLTSFCSKQLYVVPFCLICSVCAAPALERPLTPSQAP